MRIIVAVATLAGLVQSVSAQGGTILPYAGGGSGDGGSALQALVDPRGIVAGAGGALYIADCLNHRIRYVSNGVVTTIGGTGLQGFGGDGGPALNARLNCPQDVAVDSAGNVYFSDSGNNRVRRIQAQTGRIDTVAGSAAPGYGGDNGPATSASLSNPYGVAIGPNGDLFIADFVNNRIRKVGANGIITTVAGSGQWGYAGDGGPATAARLSNPTDVAVGADGTLYIADVAANRIRQVAPNGVISSLAGGVVGFAGDGGPAVQARFDQPLRLALDRAENLLVADAGNRRLRLIERQGQRTIRTIAGIGTRGSGGDGGPAVQAQLESISGVAVSPSGEIYLSCSTSDAKTPNNRVRWIDGANIIRTAVGGGVGDGGDASHALVDPRGAAVQSNGAGLPHLYFADGTLHRVRRVDGGTGIISTVAGSGEAGYSGDRGPATSARLNTPRDVAVDAQGNVYVADTLNNVVRRVSGGTITTFAGTGGIGSGGDNGLATAASLNAPSGLAIDRQGNLYIADFGGNRIRRVTPNGIISTVAGNGQWGSGGDGGPATGANLANPADVVVATDGTMYIAETAGNRIRRVAPNGVISTLAGNGYSTYGGDGGIAWAAQLNRPQQLALDGRNNLYIADAENNRIRRVDAATNIISTIAGNGQDADTGDGGSATLASFGPPTGVAIDEAGVQLFISISENSRARLVVLSGTVPPPPGPSNTPTNTFTPQPPPTPTRPAPTVTRPVPTATRTFTWTPTRTFTRTVPVPTATRTFTRTIPPPTATFTFTPTRTPTRPAQTANTPTRTRTATRPAATSQTRTATFTATRTPTRTATLRSPTRAPTFTYTPTRTFTRAAATPTRTRTFTATRPPTTRTPVPTFTATRTRTATTRATSTRTATPTPTRRAVTTPTRTRTGTIVPTRTPSPTFTATRTRTPTRVTSAVQAYRPVGARRLTQVRRLGMPAPRREQMRDAIADESTSVQPTATPTFKVPVRPR